MRRVPPLLLLLALAAVVACPEGAEAAGQGTYLFDPGGRVQATRVVDVDGDRRPDLVLLVKKKAGSQELLVLRTPAQPVPRSFYPPDHVTRISCGGKNASAGAVAIGRFGPRGGARIRFLGPEGARDLTPKGTPAENTKRHQVPTLFARSPGRDLVFWDGLADLDGDGIDECWYPLAAGDGQVRIHGGTPTADRTLTLTPKNTAVSDREHLLARYAYVPNLFPADLDGDGTRELIALREATLLGWSLSAPREAGKPLAPSLRLVLPFLEVDPRRSAKELRTPRIQIEDVDGDGKADLLVTLITGMRTNLTSIRTIFFHYPGPFQDPTTKKLVPHKARIDTPSIVLHPTFVDLDGDGDRDYVGDSIRGTMMDLIARLMGTDPKVTFVGFRFDAKAGTFERAPYFTLQRAYSSKQALSNSFGQSGWFTGDFDGDGHKDLLDLGTLDGVGISGGKAGAKGAEFRTRLLPRIPVKEGLAAGAQVIDLNGDKRSDAVLWSDTMLYLVVSKGGGR